MMTGLPAQTDTQEELAQGPQQPQSSQQDGQGRWWDQLRRTLLTVGYSVSFCLVSQILVDLLLIDYCSYKKYHNISFQGVCLAFLCKLK
ncbi:UNVERIFIED_CONTAM: hypothetical protein FKN15_057034 [Acipenser sinensis]